MSRILKRTATLLVLITGFTLVGAGPARAATGGTVTVEGTTLWYVAQPGAVNKIEISYDAELDLYLVKDFVSTVEVAGGPCTQETETVVSCEAKGVTAVKGDAGDMFDTLGVRGTLSDGVAAELHGGPGNDLVFGDSDETLYGDGGDDNLQGGSGDDTLYGGPGDDLMQGGAGIDTVSYADQQSPITADADGVLGDDGPSGQDDTIMADVENIVGGEVADRLYGTDRDDGLAGGPGDDLLVGGAGSDRLEGGDGYDILYGDGGLGGSPREVDVCAVGRGGGLTNGCEVVL